MTGGDNEAYLAAQQGRAYALYLTNGGAVGLDLRSAPGRLDVRRIEIATGEWGKRETLDGGSVATVTAPVQGHWVAAIVKAGTGPAKSPLRVHPQDSRYFIDGSGKAICLTGYQNPRPASDYPGGDGFSVELSAGTYRCESFSPAKGESGETGSVKASGGAQQFKAPFESHAVLWLGRVSAPQ